MLYTDSVWTAFLTCCRRVVEMKSFTIRRAVNKASSNVKICWHHIKYILLELTPVFNVSTLLKLQTEYHWGQAGCNLVLFFYMTLLLLFLIIWLPRTIVLGLIRTNKTLVFSCSDLRRVQVQRMEKVNLMSELVTVFTGIVFLIDLYCNINILLPLSDSDKDEGTYCPPVKRERTSSFPPPHSGKVTWWLSREFFFSFFLLVVYTLICMLSAMPICYFAVPKNNVFMPSSFCQSPTGNSDSEPGEASWPLVSPYSLKAPCSKNLCLSGQT